MALSSSPEGESRRLRLGLVVDAPTLPRWLARAIELTLRATPSEVDLVVLPGEHNDARGRTATRKPLFRRLYDGLDARRFPVQIDALTPVPPDQVPGWNPRILRIPDTTQAQTILQASGLDALLWLARATPPEGWAQTVRYGVWRWRFGEDGAASAVEPSFRTVLADSTVLGTRLTALAQDSGEHELAHSVNNVVRFSALRTEASVSWQAARLLPIAAAGIRAGTDASHPAVTPPDAPATGKALGLGAGLLKLGVQYVRHRLRNARRLEKWTLAFHRGAPGDPSPAIVPGRYTNLLPPRDRDWADPFPVKHDGVDWIFFEEFEYSRGIGYLSVAPLGVKHFTARPEPIIVEDFHLSYPFVFQHEGEYYLIPETAEQHCIQLYRAVRFPFEWKRERVLMKGTAVIDATLVEIGGVWWMFCCNLDDGRQPWSELHLFSSESPFGPWTPHPRNPVVADVRHARPAGRIFRRDNSWYRPTQDCSVAYGYALSVRRIEVLNQNEFQESEVARLDPTWEPGLCGVHTLNASDQLTLIDVRRRVWRPR
jgi:hypothetical protein